MAFHQSQMEDFGAKLLKKKQKKTWQNQAIIKNKTNKRAAWLPATWFMFGTLKGACRQMDAPLLVCYCVRVHAGPPSLRPLAASQSSLLSHDEGRGQGKVRKCRRVVWLIWRRKKRQRPAVCTLGTDDPSWWTVYPLQPRTRTCTHKCGLYRCFSEWPNCSQTIPCFQEQPDSSCTSWLSVVLEVH